MPEDNRIIFSKYWEKLTWILYLAKLLFKSEGKIKTFSDDKEFYQSQNFTKITIKDIVKKVENKAKRILQEALVGQDTDKCV